MYLPDEVLVAVVLPEPPEHVHRLVVAGGVSPYHETDHVEGEGCDAAAATCSPPAMFVHDAPERRLDVDLEGIRSGTHRPPPGIRSPVALEHRRMVDPLERPEHLWRLLEATSAPDGCPAVPLIATSAGTTGPSSRTEVPLPSTRLAADE